MISKGKGTRVGVLGALHHYGEQQTRTEGGLWSPAGAWGHPNKEVRAVTDPLPSFPSTSTPPG